MTWEAHTEDGDGTARAEEEAEKGEEVVGHAYGCNGRGRRTAEIRDTDRRKDGKKD